MEREQVEGITIDNPDSKDLDDAIYLAQDGVSVVMDVVGEFPGVEFRLVKEKNFSIATDFHG